VVSQWEKERNAEPKRPDPASSSMQDLDARQQAAAEKWLKGRQYSQRTSQSSVDRTRNDDHAPETEKNQNPDWSRDGPEDDFEL